MFINVSFCGDYGSSAAQVIFVVDLNDTLFLFQKSFQINVTFLGNLPTYRHGYVCDVDLQTTINGKLFIRLQDLLNPG